MPSDVERLFASAGELGSLSALVCAAGVLRSAPFDEITPEVWAESLDVNLTGSFLCCRAAFAAMRRSGEGRIVNFGSLSGVYATEKFPGLTAYNVSKYGVIGLTEAIAAEGKEHGISAICVSPGAVDTADAASGEPRAASRPDTGRCRRAGRRPDGQPASWRPAGRTSPSSRTSRPARPRVTPRATRDQFPRRRAGRCRAALSSPTRRAAAAISESVSNSGSPPRSTPTAASSSPSCR